MLSQMRQAGVSKNAEFDVTLDMIRAGVGLYFEYDYAEDEPETIVAEILYAARDIWRGNTKSEP